MGVTMRLPAGIVDGRVFPIERGHSSFSQYILTLTTNLESAIRNASLL